MFRTLKYDIQAVMERDPACRNVLEAVLLYPGFHALIMHRIAHFFWQRKLRFLARWLSFTARFLTNIDIHPAARIGRGFFIDHGQGVVIGETAEVGEHVTMYQGATLGGTGKERGKRHPTIGDHVVISAGAKVLGSFTVGHHARIGAGAVVLKEVPPHSTVVGVPGRVVRENGHKVTERTELDHANLPDPVEAAFRKIVARVNALEQQVRELQQERNALGETQLAEERR
jgi:serine O-acetyltransferase